VLKHAVKIRLSKRNPFTFDCHMCDLPQRPRLRNPALKQIFIQCKIYLRGNTDRQQFDNDKQYVDVPPGRISADTHEWLCFLPFVFCYFRAFTHYELFVSFHSLNFSCKTNRINPLVIISSKLPAITNVMHKLLCMLQTIRNDN